MKTKIESKNPGMKYNAWLWQETASGSVIESSEKSRALLNEIPL